MRLPCRIAKNRYMSKMQNDTEVTYVCRHTMVFMSKLLLAHDKELAPFLRECR